jgi:hypothetical protein
MLRASSLNPALAKLLRDKENVHLVRAKLRC